jgi:hypothetical protein
MSENDVRRAINYFGGMSNDRLMQELSKLLAAKRREGKEKEVLDTVERIKPLLNPEQRRRVEDILKGMNL